MNFVEDMAAQKFAEERKTCWNHIADAGKKLSKMQRCYRGYLKRKYSIYVPEGLRVLELGCGSGDLLAAVKPSCGVGVDFSSAMLDQGRNKHPEIHFIEADMHDLSALQNNEFSKTDFDVIILSDVLNDVWDARAVFEALKPFCGDRTRVVLNFHSHLWEHVFELLQKTDLVNPRLVQNWFTVEDVENIVCLAGFETIKRERALLWPWDTPIVGNFFNRYLAKLWPFSMFDLTHFMVLRPVPERQEYSVSVIIPARNEAGNIEAALQRTPDMGTHTEIIFVEGNSTDNTWDVIQKMAEKYKHRSVKALKQPGKGKGDAVRVGFEAASNEILMILDADLTMPPESLPQFYDAIASGKAEFVNGVRLVYPQEKEAMRFCNLVANKCFGLMFSWLLDTSIKDTLCGTKVISKANYSLLAANRQYFGDFDPFGDFDLIFGVSKLNLKIRDLPVRYRDRTYGETNISRWRDGVLLLRMVVFAARRIKFI